MRRQVEDWRVQQLTTAAPKLTIYRAFIEADLDIPKHLARKVHELYFTPQHPEFEARTMWSLSNAFTSAFKEFDPIPQFRATESWAGFLNQRPSPKSGGKDPPRSSSICLSPSTTVADRSNGTRKIP